MRSLPYVEFWPQDRKEEILTELENIVGPGNAAAIGSLAQQQAVTGGEMETSQEAPNTSHATFSMWTSKPLVTMNTIFEQQQVSPPHNTQNF